MKITLEQLLAGKAVLINEFPYLKTADYINPFLDFVSKFTNEFIVQVKCPSQITYISDGDVDLRDVTYNRVYIQAVLPDEYAWENHKQTISMLYGLDIKQPVAKFFQGAINMACTNLCVFNPLQLAIQKIEPNESLNYNPLNHILEVADETHVMLEKLYQKQFFKDDIFEDLGKWIDHCIKLKYNNGYGHVKLNESVPITAYKKVFYDKDSPYYKEDGVSDGLNVYNAFTQLITDDQRDLINKFEKTLLIGKLLG